MVHLCKQEEFHFAVEVCAASPDGVLWIGDGDYAYAVRFCPLCGFKGQWHFGPFRPFRARPGGKSGSTQALFVPPSELLDF